MENNKYENTYWYNQNLDTKIKEMQMINDRLEELLREQADMKLEEEKRYKENPLLQYSTTQLKAELRRRKQER